MKYKLNINAFIQKTKIKKVQLFFMVMKEYWTEIHFPLQNSKSKTMKNVYFIT